MANDAELRIGANIDALKSATDKAAAEVQKMAGQMQSSLGSIGGAFQAVQSKFAAFAALMAGGLGFQKAINAVKEQTGEAMALAKQLGITAEEANVLSTALGNAFISHDAYTSAVGAITRAINKNADGFKEMGIQVKDSSGKLRPMQEIVADTVKALEQYKAGSDRNIMANQLLGKSYDDVLALMKLTPKVMEDARQEVADYHKEIDPAAVTRYRQALENAGDAVEGVTLAVGRGAMPVFTELSEWFSQAGPTATEMTIVAMDAVVDVFNAVKSVVVGLWETISSAFNFIIGLVEETFGVRFASASETLVNAMRIVRAVVQAFAYTFEFAFEGIRGAVEVTAATLMAFSRTVMAALTPGQSASAMWESELRNIEAKVAQSAERIAAVNSKYAEKINETLIGGFNRPASKGVSKPGTKDSHTLGGDKGDKSGADKSRLSAWEAELGEAKVYYQKTYELREYSKEQEKEYWQSILRNVNVTGQERIGITKKVSELELEIMRKSAAEKKALDAQAINTREKIANDELAAEQQAAEQEYELGRISKEQLLDLQRQYEDRRTAIQEAAQAARITAALGDPNMDPVTLQQLLDQMAEIQRAHALRIAKIQGDAALQTRNAWLDAMSPITSAFEKSVTGMIMGTTTLRKAMSNMLQSILGEFVNMLVKKAAMWAANELSMTAMTRSGMTMRTLLEKMGLIESQTLQETAATTTMATKASEATAVVGSNAAEAASGAAASQASIPYVGWAMAGAAFAAVMAMVLGAKGSIKSASGGFDIPSGVNPVTQLHQEEMVLPAQYANMIRGMASGGGGGGGMQPTIIVKAMDSRDVIRSLKEGGAAHKVLKDLHRSFAT